MTARRIAVSGGWVLTGFDGAVPRVVPGATVVVEEGRISAVTTEAVSDAERHDLGPQTLMLPGFVDLHCHALNGPLFRGTTEDRPRSGSDGTLVYDVLMPVGDMAAELLSVEEAQAVYTSSLLRILRGGTTTLLDMFRLPRTGTGDAARSIPFLDAARQVGMRVYGAPYLASQKILGVDVTGQPVTQAVDGRAGLRRVRQVFSEYDEGSDGRVRVAFGPHCTDTCAPNLLSEIAATAGDLGALVTIHAAQSRPEVRYLRERYGQTPIQYMTANGLAGPGVVAAHCAFASEDDVGILADTGTAVACCPATFAHSGHSVDYRRYADRGITTGIGTDGHSVGYLDELRVAGLVSKLASGVPQTATAVDLLRAATQGGAQAVGRADVGALQPRARADVVAIGLDDAGVQPVLDPLRTVVWHHGGARTRLVMVDGDVLVSDGRHVRLDERSIERRASEAIRRVWAHAAATRGTEPSDLPVPHTGPVATAPATR